MSLWWVLVAASVQGSVDCEPPAPAEQPDAESAVLYEQVGADELARGNAAAASAAFSEALRRGAPRERLLPQFTRACAESKGRGLPFAVEVLREQGCAAAAPLLSAYSDLGDGSAQLLRGICLYESGQYAEAIGTLEHAAKQRELEQHARLFIGLSAAKLGERGRAMAELELVQGGAAAELRTTAARLLRSTRRRGLLSFVVSAHGGLDSNVDLAPLGSPSAAGAGDALGLFRAAIELRPNRDDSGPFLLLTGSARKQASFVAFDAYSGGGNAGYLLTRERLRASFDYGFDALYLNAAPYATKHALNLSGSYFIGRAWLTGGYRPALSFFLPPSAQKWSGVRHVGLLDAGWAPRDWLTVWGGYRAARDLTRGQGYPSTIHGPAAGVSALFLDRFQGIVRAQLERRRFDFVDEAFSVRREDLAFDVGATAEYRLTSFVAVSVDVTYRRVESTIPALTHEQVLATVGLSVGAGLL